MKNARIASISAENDTWLRRATAASIARAKDLVAPQGPIRSTTPVGKLSDSEWGWIASTVVWRWISIERPSKRQAKDLIPSAQLGSPSSIPDPWDVGAIRAILPELAKSCAGFDWTKPANTWTKDELAEFLASAFALIQRAMAARDLVEEQLAGKPTSADITARQMNGSVGNPRMTVAEFHDGADF